MTFPNIALTGHLRSGKDTVAAYLCQNYGYTRFAFGDGMREVCRRLYPQQFADGTKPRALLQGVAQALRQFDENVWVSDMFRRIEQNKRLTARTLGIDVADLAPTRYVVSDLRQSNEYAALKAAGYVIIRIKAQSAHRIQRATESGDSFNPADLTHETESHVDTFAVDYEIINDGTLAELYTQIDVIITQIKEAAE